MAEPPLKPRAAARALCCLAIMAERRGRRYKQEAKQGPSCECQGPWPVQLLWAGAAGLGCRGIKGKIRSISGLGLWHGPIFPAPAEHVTEHTYRSHWEGKAYGLITSKPVPQGLLGHSPPSSALQGPAALPPSRPASWGSCQDTKPCHSYCHATGAGTQEPGFQGTACRCQATHPDRSKPLSEQAAL